MPLSTSASDTGHCRSCQTPLPHSEPILVKFQRCNYCGRHHPLGGTWTLTTAPVVVAATLGLLAIVWTHLPS